MTALPLLDVKDLTVEFTTRRGIVKAVQHVDIEVGKGETLGIVGESGSGKSVTSYAVMRILDRAGSIAEGSVMFSGIDVKAASETEMRDLRGREISMIFQNPRAALNPIRSIGRQLMSAGLRGFTDEQLDFFHYGCGLDTTRMRTLLGFHPQLTTAEAFDHYLSGSPRRPVIDPDWIDVARDRLLDLVGAETGAPR